MEEIRTMLEKVAAGEMTVEDAVLELKKEPFTAAGFDDLGFAKLDTHRKLRQGAAEVIYGAGKTAEQIAGIVEAMKKRGQQVILITRLDKEKAERTASLLGTPLSEKPSNGTPLSATPSNGAPLSETLLHGPQNEVFRYFSDAQIGLCGEFPKKDGVGTIVVATGGSAGESGGAALRCGSRRPAPADGPYGFYYERAGDHCHCGYGGRAGQCYRRTGGLPGNRGSNKHRIRGFISWRIGAPVHAELLRQRGQRREYRQRFWSGILGQYDQSSS